LLDQLSKVAVRAIWSSPAASHPLDRLMAPWFAPRFRAFESLPLMGDWLRLSLVHNQGAAFGLLPGQRTVFVITSLVVLAVLGVFWWRLKPRQPLVVVGLALAAAGAVGNLIDRTVIGTVTDFIDVAAIRFPVFNIADSAITVGAAILVGWLLFAGDAEAAEKTESGEGELVMSPVEYYEHVVTDEEQGMRLDAVLGALDIVVSRSAAARLIEDGHVTVDGQPALKRRSVRAGERIEVELMPRRESTLEPEFIPLDIRYEDSDMIVLSKQAGLVVHPAHGHWSGTLVHALLAHSEDLGTLQGEDRPGIVHRLDKDTSGLMMVAKSDAAQVTLQEAIKIRSVDRRYITLVHGWIAPDTGLIDAPLSRDQRDRMRMSVTDRLDAKQSVTTFRVLERFEAGEYDDGFTLLECKLYTGRTHQIRVHMAYIKHPCVGDPIYGSAKVKADLGLERQFLHAYRLELEHPITGAKMRFVDPLPEDLQSRLDSLAPLSAGRTAAGEEVLALIAEGPQP
jgi:23S rRNA pseudouridine1911/1915/1917 synthase